MFVDVGEATGGRILPPVLEHPEAQCLLIEGELPSGELTYGSFDAPALRGRKVAVT